VDHPSLSWLQNIFVGDYKQASFILRGLAEEETELLQRKKVVLYATHSLLMLFLISNYSFNYFGCNIFYERKKVLNIKIINCVRILGNIDQIFKPLCIHKFMTLIRLTSYHSESWTVRTVEARLISAEKYFI
jgi:hypothetical protein